MLLQRVSNPGLWNSSIVFSILMLFHQVTIFIKSRNLKFVELGTFWSQFKWIYLVLLMLLLFLALGMSQNVLVSLLQNNKDVGGRRYSLHINKLGKKILVPLAYLLLMYSVDALWYTMVPLDVGYWIDTTCIFQFSKIHSIVNNFFPIFTLLDILEK